VRGLPFLALLALLARVSPSHAEEQELPLDLEWSAPEGCASAEQIRAELGRIARVRPGRSISRLSARGRIDKAGDAYRLTLRTERNGQTGERSLSAKECRSLEREVTLVLAVAFGEGVEIVEESSVAGTGVSGQPTPAPAEDAHPPVAPAATASAKASQKAAAESPETAKVKPSTHPEAGGQRPLTRREAGLKPRFATFLGGGVEFETLPSPAALVVAGAELGWKAFWFEPRFVWLPHVGETLERGVQARYDGFGGALAACHVLPPVSWSLNACLGWEATAVRARSSGATDSGDAVAPLYAGVFSLAWEWPTRGALSLRLEAALHVAFNEPRFVIEGLGEVHQVPLLAPSLAAMLTLFPGR
jgi:hypothetical protein